MYAGVPPKDKIWVEKLAGKLAFVDRFAYLCRETQSAGDFPGRESGLGNYPPLPIVFVDV